MTLLAAPPTTPLLQVEDLSVRFGEKIAVDRLSFSLYPQESLAIVGESGSGKTSLLHALVQMGRGTQTGQVAFPTLPPNTPLLGRHVGMLFQDPLSSLNPTMSVGEQIIEGLLYHRLLSKKEARKKGEALLEQLGLFPAQERFAEYPHELSGGMRQRVSLAIALALDPLLLFADEPTTALDPATEKNLLDLLFREKERRNMGLILITHDLFRVAARCDRILVLQRGTLVEEGPSQKILSSPSHPYTQSLLQARPRPHQTKREPLSSFHLPLPPSSVPPPISLVIENLSHTFALPPKPPRTLLQNLSFSIHSNEIVGVVGKSGSGKTTLAKILLGLLPPTQGTILLQGKPLQKFSHKERSLYLQMVFQDPLGSLNPRLTIEAHLQEPFLIHHIPYSTKTLDDLLDSVGIASSQKKLYPHELSGGQRQRVGLARALALSPSLLLLDEPIASLDTQTQAQIIDLLVSIQKARQCSYLFISHDLEMVHYLSDRIVLLA